MTKDATDIYISYLSAKRHVDDRSLNRHVWQTLKANLPSSHRRRYLEVIDFGAGIGSMFDRSIEWGLTSHLHYTMVEKNAAYLTIFRSAPSRRKTTAVSTFDWKDDTHAAVRFSGGEGTVELICADLYDVISDPDNDGRWDVIMAHAVMDLVNIDDVLTGFERLAKPGGLIYLSLNYDGLTEFLPPFDPEFAYRLIASYHRSMDQRTIEGRPSGSSRSGRELLFAVTRRGLPILAAGSSDWILHPNARGYPDDDAVFLKMILRIVEEECRRDDHIDPQRLAAWMTRRHSQIDAAELIFIARNIDILVKVPAV